MKSIEKHAYIWNGSEPGWVVIRYTTDREKLEIIFTGSGPTIPEIKALHMAVPLFKAKSAGEVFQLAKGQSQLDIGDFESREARAVRRQCEALGLRVATRGYQSVSYCLFNEVTKVLNHYSDVPVRDVVE